LFVDLHAHSTASDGLDSPEVVVRRAQEVGLAALALTDHDTVGGIPAAASAAAALGLRLVAGVELSTHFGTRETHLLGLHVADLALLDRELAAYREARLERAAEIVRKLNDLGVRVTFEEVLAVARGAAVGRPHVARALVESGWAMDLRDAFDRYLGDGGPAYVEKRKMLVSDAIDLIHRAGGLAILAHPDSDFTLGQVRQMKEWGLDGLEVLHPSHSVEVRGLLAQWCEELELLPSGGSDSHNVCDPTRGVGSVPVPAAWLVGQDMAIAGRGTSAEGRLLG
jgi:predicted metal-dependent phosphoesterase TrpH